MVRKDTPACEFGRPTPDFSLPGVDGAQRSLEDCMGPKGLVVMFICNHCPYVIAVQERLVQAAEALADLGIGVVAINANDTERYPADNFENMKRVATEQGYPFPYLLDETQDVARAYGAVCTPDFFGFNAAGELHYRGRLDATTPNHPAPADAPLELVDAMAQVAETGQGPVKQTPSMGCSIKWRDN